MHLYDFNTFLFVCLSFINIFVIKFLGLTLVNKIIQVSSIDFHNTSSVYYIYCLLTKVKFPSLTIYRSSLFLLPPLTVPYPLVTTTVFVVCSYEFLFVYLVCSFFAFSFIFHKGTTPAKVYL